MHNTFLNPLLRLANSPTLSQPEPSVTSASLSEEILTGAVVVEEIEIYQPAWELKDDLQERAGRGSKSGGSNNGKTSSVVLVEKVVQAEA